jgi:hypothetical protein
MPLRVEHRGRDAHVWTDRLEVLDAACAASAISDLTEMQDSTVLPDDNTIHKIALARVEARITSYAT